MTVPIFPLKKKEFLMTLDLDFIRSQYSVFANPETARWAMFENAGGWFELVLSWVSWGNACV
jgi:hypothetical protein